MTADVTRAAASGTGERSEGLASTKDVELNEAITERVRERYAAAAQRVSAGASCCGADGPDAALVSAGLYGEDEVATLPEEAVLASLGCGNPTALIELRAGETVLDLGSGGGIDVLLSARRVGPEGFVYGLDMTEEMLALAQENKAKAGARNVAFLKGRIEDVPLPANTVDVVISNCVINLAADKGQVLREAFRVLKPGGRFAVSDVVAEGEVPAALRRNMEAWVGCLAGALEVNEYERLLRAAGFTDVSVTITKRYTAAGVGLDTSALPGGWEAFDGSLASAFVRATKPAAGQSAAAGGIGEAQTNTPARLALQVVAVDGDGCCGTSGDCCS